MKVENGPLFWGANRFCKSAIVSAKVAVSQTTGSDTGQATLEVFLNEREFAPLASADWPTGLDFQNEPDLSLCQLAAFWAARILNEVRGSIWVSGARRDGQNIWAWVGFHDASLSEAVLQFSIECLYGVFAGRHSAGDEDARLQSFFEACRVRHPDFQAGIVMQAARARDIPYSPAWGIHKHWRYGEGARSTVLRESSSARSGAFGTYVAQSKVLTKRTLQTLGLPVPPGFVLQRDDDIEKAIAAVGFPCVTKPINLSGGKGVTAGLRNAQAVRAGVAAARAQSAEPVLVEQFVDGEDYRLMIVDGVLVAAIRRDPPVIVGDGRQSVSALAKHLNAKRFAHSLVRSNFHRPVQLDQSAFLHLADQGLTPEAVPELGQRVSLRSNANLSTGGTCIDVTDAVHPSVRFMAEGIAGSLDMPMLGVDYMSKDISKGPYETGGRFIEINATPGLEVLVAAGWSVEAAGGLCLSNDLGRVPKAMLVVEDRILPELIKMAGRKPWPDGMGWASAQHAVLNGVPLMPASRRPFAALHTLLEHKQLKSLVILIDRSAVRRFGVPVEQVDYASVMKGIGANLKALVSDIASETDWQTADTTPAALLEGAKEQLGSL